MASTNGQCQGCGGPHLPRGCIAGCNGGWEAAVVDQALSRAVEVQDVVWEGCCRGLEVQIAGANTCLGLGGRGLQGHTCKNKHNVKRHTVYRHLTRSDVKNAPMQSCCRTMSVACWVQEPEMYIGRACVSRLPAQSWARHLHAAHSPFWYS